MSQPLLQLTIARTPENFGPRRSYNVRSEMASGPRPRIRRSPSKMSDCSPRTVDLDELIDVEFVVQRGRFRNFLVKMFPIILGAWCAVMAVSTIWMDYQTRYKHDTELKYSNWAEAHGERFVPNNLPSISHMVDTLNTFRAQRTHTKPFDFIDNGFIRMDNRTPDYDTNLELDLLAIGSARVAAEAVRAGNEDAWNVFVPTDTIDLLAYNGEAFTDAVLVAGDEHALFPPSKTYKILNDGGLAVQHIPIHIDGADILKNYHKAFGGENVRVDCVQPGSNVIVATKNGKLPSFADARWAHANNNRYEIHYY